MATSKGLSDSPSGSGINLYLTLSRFLNLHITAARNLGHVKDAFLGHPTQKRPYIIGLTGSVAAMKCWSSSLSDIAVVNREGRAKMARHLSLR